MPGEHLHMTKVEVSLLPPSNPDRWLFTVAVEARDLANDRWAVTWLGACLSREGKWEQEPIPSEREEPWLDEHRFGYDEALQLARVKAPFLELNGRFVRDVLDEDGAR